MNIQIILAENNNTMIYAKSDKEHFLSKYANVTFNVEQKIEYKFVLKLDKDLKEHWYSLCDSADGFSICGGTYSSILCGVYELLSRMWIFFDTNGDTLNDALDFDVLRGMKDVIKPPYQSRGIRQHINLLMDISSYNLQKRKSI